MKKISVMLTALFAALAFTACDESKDDHPTINTHEGTLEAPFLNTPEMANMYVTITENNSSQTLHMTCSQPDYGFAAQVQYQVEVSFDQNFQTPAVEECPASVTLDTSFNNCGEINPPLSEIAQAMCKMLGIESDAQVTDEYYPMFMRLIANVKCVTGAPQQLYPNTSYISNTVSFKGISCQYLAIVIPGLPTGIYLRGDMNNWGTPDDAQFMTTSESGVYEIESYDIKAGQGFKVADSSWSDPNCGSNGTNPKFNEDYVMVNGTNDNIFIDSDFSGRIQLTVKNGTYTLLLEAAEPDTPGLPSGIYLRGVNDNWDAQAEWEFLTTDYKNNWLLADVTIPANNKFKIADANWGSVNLGYWTGEELPIGEMVLLETGGGNITMPVNFTGSVSLKVKGGLYYVTFTQATEE